MDSGQEGEDKLIQHLNGLYCLRKNPFFMYILIPAIFNGKVTY